MIFLYDWAITLGWEGEGGSRGKVHIPSFSEDQEQGEEVVMEVQGGMRQEHVVLKQEVLLILEQYVEQLKNFYSSSTLLPNKDGTKPLPNPVQKVAKKMVDSKEPSMKTKNEVAKKKPRRKKTKGSNDFLFYLTLVSIVGLTVGIGIRLSRMR